MASARTGARTRPPNAGSPTAPTATPSNVTSHLRKGTGQSTSCMGSVTSTLTAWVDPTVIGSGRDRCRSDLLLQQALSLGGKIGASDLSPREHRGTRSGDARHPARAQARPTGRGTPRPGQIRTGRQQHVAGSSVGSRSSTKSSRGRALSPRPIGPPAAQASSISLAPEAWPGGAPSAYSGTGSETRGSRDDQATPSGWRLRDSCSVFAIVDWERIRYTASISLTRPKRAPRRAIRCHRSQSSQVDEAFVEAAGSLYRVGPRKTRVDRKGTRRASAGKRSPDRHGSASTRVPSGARRHQPHDTASRDARLRARERAWRDVRVDEIIRIEEEKSLAGCQRDSGVSSRTHAARGLATKRIRGSEVTIDSTASAVPSSDPSSTTIASQSPYVWARTDSSVSTTVSAAFRAGTTTDTRTDDDRLIGQRHERHSQVHG